MGKKFGQELEKNKVFLLSGELGGGKTQFVKGLAEGLGIAGPITSPTFTFERIYENEKGPSLYHFDLYRSEELDPDIACLIEEAIAGGNVVAIEWAERAKRIWPKDAYYFNFKWLDENKRELEVSEF